MLVNLPSRAELLTWVSDLTKTKVQRIEQLSDGVQFCQIFDLIYPKSLNLNKLKKDAKVALEKEKNFRVLLNAINQLELKVTISIMDLAGGKVTSILELLQWMWKEYQKPSHEVKKDGKEDNEIPPKMIRSYIGKLVTRPHFSLAKENAKSELTHSVGSGRRSLDARLNSIPKTQKSDGKSVKTAIVQIHSNQQKNQKMEESQAKDKNFMKHASEKKPETEKVHFNESIGPHEKNLDVSQTKDLTVFVQMSEKLENRSQKQQNQSVYSSKSHPKMWVLNQDKESLNKLDEEKKESFKRMKAEKESLRKKKDMDMSQIMDSTLSLDREKLCQKLIKVTGAVLESNPQLESKLKNLLSSNESSEKQKLTILDKSYSNGLESMDSSNKNTSLQCQAEQFFEIDIDGPSNCDAESNQRNEITVEPPKKSNSFFLSNIEMNPEKKEILGLFASRQKDHSPNRQIVLPPQVIKQISAQKQKAQNSHHEEKIQDKQENQINRMHISNFQRPFNHVQNKTITGINYFTQKKNEPNGQIFTSKKQIQSENPNLHRFYGHNQSKETQNKVNPQKDDKPAQTMNADGGEKKKEDVQYPELEPYQSVHAPKSSSLPFF